MLRDASVCVLRTPAFSPVEWMRLRPLVDARGVSSILGEFNLVILDELMIRAGGPDRPLGWRDNLHLEYRAYAEFAENVVQSIHERNVTSFENHISGALRLFGVDAGKFRSQAVRAGAKNNPTIMLYPQHDNMHSRFVHVWDAIDGVTDDPMLRAIYHYVSFLNIHPFLDGNGRMSRVVF